MIFNSIRWRLQAWHGLILVTVLVGFGLTAYHVARDNQLRRIDQELTQHLMFLFRPQPPEHPPDRSREGPPDSSMAEHRGERRWDPAESLRRIREAIQQAGALEAAQTNTYYYVLWQQDGSVLARSAGAPTKVPAPACVGPRELGSSQARDGLTKPPFPRPGPPLPLEVRTRGELRELVGALPHGQFALVGRSMAPDLAAMRRLALRLVAAGASVLLLGLAGGWWLATRAIQPIEDISATAMKIAGGDLSQRINAADTESELGRLAGVLNSTFARLEAAFAHQARFTADASHELRTPLAVMLTQTQTALSRERGALEYREALQACQRAATRMRTLTESLLQLARLDAGQEPMKREPLDLAKAAHECIELVRPLAVERGIAIHSHLAEVTCLGDAGRMGQVVTNLLTNAINFNRDHGQVSVTTRAQDGSAMLAVTDTGEGIAAEELPHIFERFYRVDKSRSRVQGRNGLGLAICKAMVDTQGGTINVSSQPGTGTTFTVKLPLK